MPHDTVRILCWRKSSASAQGDCLEVAISTDSILIRDSKKRTSNILEFSFSEWQAFLTGVRRGEFDREQLERSRR